MTSPPGRAAAAAPLVLTAGAVRALSTVELRLGAAPAGWHRVDRALDEGRVAGWLAGVERSVGRTDVATSFLGTWIAAPVVTVTAAAVLLEGVSPGVSLDSAWLRPHPSGWFDGLALTDPAGPRTTGSGAGQVRQHWAAGTVAVVGPLLAAVTAAGRFGARGQWGNAVVDRLVWLATELGRQGYGDTRTFLVEAERMLDALEPVAPVQLPRGRVMPVPAAAGEVLLPVKGTCCLLYKTVPPARRSVDEYCTGCPLVPDATRPPRWLRWSDGEGAP